MHYSNSKSSLRIAALTLGLATVALFTTNSRAANYTYHVDMNVGALSTAPNAPFFLDFQLNAGGNNGASGNSVTLNNFVFTGGAATGSANTSGNVSGSLGAGLTLTLNTNNPFNEFYQSFSTSTTDIQFDVSSTQFGAGISPDGFAVAILDSEANNPQIATNAPDTVSLLMESINGSVSMANVATYSSTNPTGVTASAVPEPSTTALMLLGGCGGLVALIRRRNRS
ncbi:MAG: NF038129 family PEP-CTERM protein [Verrucomicrobia bacterium]|nr:NF038129 family PEP-CTERM protein [Verrucomicrobiota bacterium]